MALIAATRAGSLTRSTRCATPSTVTSPTSSPAGASSSLSPAAKESPHTGDRLARVALVRSRRSVEAFGVVRSWGSTPPAPSSTTSNAPITPTRSRSEPDGIGETHSVHGERRLVIAHQDAVVDPLTQQRGGAPVAVGAARRDIDVDDVVRRPGAVLLHLLGGHHVVRRGDEHVEGLGGRGVAQGAERFESRHAGQVATPRPTVSGDATAPRTQTTNSARTPPSARTSICSAGFSATSCASRPATRSSTSSKPSAGERSMPVAADAARSIRSPTPCPIDPSTNNCI